MNEILLRFAPRSLRRYRQACSTIAPGQEPQCWMAETEIGEAWRAMPLPLRVGLLLFPQPYPLDVVWEISPRLGRAVVAWREES